MQTTETHVQVLITIADRLTLPQAARLIGKSPSCLFRWWRDGVAGVRLQCLRFGRSLFTSEAAIEQFAREVSAAKSQQFRNNISPVATTDHVVAGL